LENRFLAYDEKTILDEAFKYYRENGFPYKEMPLHMQLQEINKLRARDHANDLINSSLCYDVADSYHKHRFHGHAKGKNSPIDAFNDDKKLRKTLRMHLEGSAIKTGWFGMLAMVSNTQACANFRPAFAKYLYTKYCGDVAPNVLDTSTGYGGRLLGWYCSFAAGNYVGIDPSTQTHEANKKMIDDLRFSDRVTLINEPAEDVSLPKKSFDVAFTSPPYFRKEEYCDEKTQSWIRYPEQEAWREGFLIPMLKLQFESLKPGAINIVNINDVNIGQKKVPLVDWTVEGALGVGFTFVERLDFPMTRRLGANMDEGVAVEPVLVFRR
jgi:16S rRNA G966 N2-methylase RsmD